MSLTWPPTGRLSGDSTRSRLVSTSETLGAGRFYLLRPVGFSTVPHSSPR